MNGIDVDGRPISVEVAKPREREYARQAQSSHAVHKFHLKDWLTDVLRKDSSLMHKHTRYHICTRITTFSHAHMPLDLQGMVTGRAMGRLPTLAGREVEAEVQVDVGTPETGAKTGIVTEIVIVVGTESGKWIRIGTVPATIATPHRCVGMYAIVHFVESVSMHTHPYKPSHMHTRISASTLTPLPTPLFIPTLTRTLGRKAG